MTEMEPREAGMDNLLRRSMTASIPVLSADFEQQLMRDVGRGTKPLDRCRQMVVTGYGLSSIVVSAIIMRGQGLNWLPISVMILSPLLLVAAAIPSYSRRPAGPLVLR